MPGASTIVKSKLPGLALLSCEAAAAIGVMIAFDRPSLNRCSAKSLFCEIFEECGKFGVWQHMRASRPKKWGPVFGKSDATTNKSSKCP